MKKAFVIMAALLLSACSVKEPSIGDKFLKNFEGYSTLEDTDNGAILKIEQGGRRLNSPISPLSFAFVRATSETTGVYNGQGGEIVFIFTTKGNFTLNSSPGILKK